MFENVDGTDFEFADLICLIRSFQSRS